MSRRQGCRTRKPVLFARLAPAVLLLSIAATANAQTVSKTPTPDKPPTPDKTLAPGKVPATQGSDKAVAPGPRPGAPDPAPPADAIVRGESDPVVASVEGHQIHLSDLGRASNTLPENLRTLPFETLFPILLERMVDHQALVRMARQRGLDDNPAVRQEMDAAVERVLEGAYLALEAMPKVTDQAVQARYNQQFANRPATEEVHARHILVTTEAQAKDLIEQLRKGADFATLARAVSKDPDGQRGGDLGFFRRDQVWPTFADVAFSLPPGQISPMPIHNEFGWHVVKVEERRLVAPPSFSDVRDSLRQELTTQMVQLAVQQARSQLVIRRFNLDGTEMSAVPAR